MSGLEDDQWQQRKMDQGSQMEDIEDDQWLQREHRSKATNGETTSENGSVASN